MTRLWRRTISLAALVGVLLSALTVRLFQVQIRDHARYTALRQRHDQTRLTVPAARGEILDRYGEALAKNEIGFRLVIDAATFPADAAGNAVLDRVLTLLDTRGETWNDLLLLDDNGQFSTTAARAVKEMKAFLSLPETATVEKCLSALSRRYQLADYSDDRKRVLGSVRYAMERQGFRLTNPFILADSLSRDTAYFLRENSAAFPGLTPQSIAVREYVGKTTAAHLIGTTGPIYAEEYAALREKGYAISDRVGKSGIEAVMEDTLRGKKGTRVWVRNAQGQVVREYDETAAVAGNTVVLTLSKKLQETAQASLSAALKQLQAQSVRRGEYKGQDIRSASAVLLDVADGGVLACASEPGFDLSAYNRDYAALLSDASNPLFNRALSGAFACGSVIKPAVAAAGLETELLTPADRPVDCQKVYTYYSTVGFSPKCTGRHGKVSLSAALQKSCNIYFYDLGRRLGIDRMNRYLSAFGLGKKTGIEIGEAAGVLSSPENKGGKWVAGDTCQAAIGQLNDRFTPIQLAAYVMMLADGGVRYRTHLVQEIRAYDGTRIRMVTPEVAEKLSLRPTTLSALREGMTAVTREGGTAALAFRGASYTVAGKTGTAQNGVSDRSDHGLFIGYAPAEAPEVAIAVVMENGTAAPAARCAREILDAYFAQKKDAGQAR